jgi:predicted RNase H-like HicB family nuclease
MATQKIRGPDGKDHEATPVGFQNAREYWNEYLLDDGTIIRLKLVATEVLRIEDMRDANGAPTLRSQVHERTRGQRAWYSRRLEAMTTATRNAPDTEPTPTSPRLLQPNDPAAWQGPRPIVALPGDLMNRYVTVALRRAVPSQTPDGQWYCALDQFQGVWAQEGSPKECLDTLEEVLREWLVLKIVDGDRDIPVVDEIDLTVVSRRFIG